ncbi:hypothetical protein AX15_007641 [Amanita polypyramis BW_CC]|nr:hypothetical protein AX15_007641 [Amanita polypyramis BW_CC]
MAQFWSKAARPQPGFLVGFFGSPMWETKITLTVHKTLHERRRSFFTAEHPPCTGYPKCSDYTLKESTIDTCRWLHPTFSSGRVLEAPSLAYNHQSEKKIVICTPRLPPLALSDSSRVIPQRTRSLPSTTRSNVHRAQIGRSCSTRARRGKHPKPGIDTAFIAPPPSPKVPDDSVMHISPLSFSPLFGLGYSEQYAKLFGPATGRAPASPSPSPSSLNIQVNLNSSMLCNSSNEASRQCSLITEDFMASCAVTKADCQGPLLSRQARIPLFDVYTSADFDDETLSTLPPINPVTMFKLRPRHNTLSIRTKRSPSLGPSPLRRMILPESSDSDLSSKADHESLTMLFEQDIPNPLSKVKHPECDLSSDQRVTTNWADLRTIEDNNADPLLGLIRELVEEVNDWDESLVMDENFKTMIEKSQDPPLNKDQRSSTTESHVTGSCSEDQGKPRVASRPQDTGSNEYLILSGGGQLISFLEEDLEDKADNIGIAR